MDKTTAYLAGLAIICATMITAMAIFKLTGQNPAAKEIAILAITAMFSAISGGGVGYMIGKKAETEDDKV